MWIALFVGVLVMNAVSGDPRDGSAFERERAAKGEEIFHPDGSLVPAVGEQAVVAHADTETAGDAIKNDGYGHARPRQHKERSDGAHVESNHEAGGGPVERLLKGSVF